MGLLLPNGDRNPIAQYRTRHQRGSIGLVTRLLKRAVGDALRYLRLQNRAPYR
jgi:hypothetical protein